jgi:hypothetical protein
MSDKRALLKLTLLYLFVQAKFSSWKVKHYSINQFEYHLFKLNVRPSLSELHYARPEVDVITALCLSFMWRPVLESLLC